MNMWSRVCCLCSICCGALNDGASRHQHVCHRVQVLRAVTMYPPMSMMYIGIGLFRTFARVVRYMGTALAL